MDKVAFRCAGLCVLEVFEATIAPKLLPLPFPKVPEMPKIFYFLAFYGFSGAHCRTVVPPRLAALDASARIVGASVGALRVAPSLGPQGRGPHVSSP